MASNTNGWSTIKLTALVGQMKSQNLVDVQCVLSLSGILLTVFLEHVATTKLCEKSGSSNNVASKTLDT